MWTNSLLEFHFYFRINFYANVRIDQVVFAQEYEDGTDDDVQLWCSSALIKKFICFDTVLQ